MKQRKKNLRRLCVIGLLLVGSLLMGSCSDHVRPIAPTKEESRTVATVDGEAVPYEELRYLTLTAKAMLAGRDGETIWEDAAVAEAHRAELETYVYDHLADHAALMALCREAGIRPTDKDVKETVTAQVDAMVEQAGGLDAYRDRLASQYLTDHLLRTMLADAACRTRLTERYYEDGVIDTSDETAWQALRSDAFIRTLHVFIQQDAGEDRAANRARAEEALACLRNGDSLTSVIGRYSEDYYMTTTDGYYFTRGEYDPAYEEAAFALAVGEYSEVVATADGYYVIARLEKEDTYLEDHFETLKDRYLYVVLDNKIAERKQTMTVALTDAGEAADLVALS